MVDIVIWMCVEAGLIYARSFEIFHSEFRIRIRIRPAKELMLNMRHVVHDLAV